MLLRVRSVGYSSISVNAPIETALLADDAETWPRNTPVVEAAPTNAPQPAVASLPRRDLENEIFGLVYRQMRSLVGRRPEFDDLVQTAAEQTLRSLGSFEGRSKLSTWTYRICYLTLLKHERWYRRWLRRFALAEPADLVEMPQQAPGTDADFEKMERSARLRRAIERLSAKRRAVVILHDLEGLSIEQIAGVVRANALTVRSRLRDGRQALSTILSNDAYFGDEACRREEIER